MRKFIGVLFFVCSFAWGQTSLFPAPLYVAPAPTGIFLDTGLANNTGGSSVSTDQTIAVTVANNTNRYLGVWIECIAASTGITNVTYHGVGMTQRLDRLSGTDSFTRLQYWDLVNPDTGNNNLVITPSVNERLAWTVRSMYGVHQTTPRGTVVSSDGTSGTASVNATSASGEVVIDGAAVSGANPMTAGGSQTNVYKIDTNDPIGGSQQPGAGTVTMSWTFSSTTWIIGAVPLKPA
jgi:hypothetical protein